MMGSLFSMFDPSNYFLFSEWFLILFVILSFFQKENVKSFLIFNYVSDFLKIEFLSLIGSNVGILVFIPLFMSIVVLNLISMVPYFYIFTAQVSFILPMSLVLWLMGIMYFLLHNLNSFFSHLVPFGSPFFLMPLLVIIESVSIFIRPFTIAIRIIANITSGHLLIHLLSSFIISSEVFFILLCCFFLIMVLLTIVELGVAVIQGYIFCTLLALYSSEIN